MSTSIDADLKAAHQDGDPLQLVDIYQKAAAQAGELSERCFFLTHAYVFALEAGIEQASVIRAELVKLGAEPSD